MEETETSNAYCIPQNDRSYKLLGETITLKNYAKDVHTFTIWVAAASGGMPRQQSRAISALRASQTPSLLRIILPPAVESCKTRHEWKMQDLSTLGRKKYKKKWGLKD